MVYFFAFSGGALLAPFLPPQISWLVLSCATAISAWCAWRTRESAFSPFAVSALVFVLGGTVGVAQIEWRISRQLPEAFAGQDFTARFEVVSLPRSSARATTFNAVIKSVSCSSDCPPLLNRKVRLSWYRPRQSIAAGDVWYAEVRLKPPRGFANPGAFDYHAWLLGQGIAATGYIRGQSQHLGRTRNLAAVRSAVADKVFNGTDMRFQRFLRALLIGDKAGLSEDDWALLQRTGTIHLMAISGLHIGLVASAAFLLGAGVVRIAGLVMRSSGVYFMHAVPPILAIVAATAYAALAGFTIPTVRALLGCLAVNFCLLVCARVSPWWVLGGCLCLVVLLEPFASLNAGFWLSFLAVLTLLYCFGGRRVRAWQFLQVQWVLLLGLAVPLLLLGQNVAWLGPLANTLAVPLVTFSVVPLLLLGAVCKLLVPTADSSLLSLSDWTFALLWQWLEWVGQLSVPPLMNQWAGQCSVLLAAAAVTLLLAPRGLYLRSLGAVLLLVALLPLKPAAVVRLSVLDVGQGLAAVVQTPGSLWVFDTGPKYSESFDTGAAILAPYVLHQGIPSINLFVSHNDGDHAGGTAGFIRTLADQGFVVDAFYAAEPLQAGGTQAERCEAGQVIEAPGMTLSTLWPPVDHALKGNDASCVMLVTLHQSQKDVHILLPGDISKAVEHRVLSQLPLPIDIVLAPHHGSASSSSATFVYNLEPQYAVFSAGYRNRYGHPHPDVAGRYLAAGSQLLNTAEDGAIMFQWDENGKLRLSRWRQQADRRWFAH